MINLIKNQSNTAIFTLQEKTTIVDALYYIEVYSNQNHDSKVMTLSGDSSANIARYNQFDIIENDTEDLTGGTISLIAGTYDYFVWQSASAPFDKLKSSIVESGKMNVTGTGTTSTTFTDNNNEITFE